MLKLAGSVSFIKYTFFMNTYDLLELTVFSFKEIKLEQIMKRMFI